MFSCPGPPKKGGDLAIFDFGKTDIQQKRGNTKISSLETSFRKRRNLEEDGAGGRG